MVKPIFTILLLLVFANDIISQHSHIDLCEVTKKAILNQSVDTVDQLLQIKDTSKITKMERAELLSFKAWLWLKINEDNLDKKSSLKGQILTQAYRDFTLAINEVEDENEKLIFEYHRYSILESYKPKYKDYTSDLNRLKAHGYKKDKLGLGLVAVAKYDGDIWLGGELALFSGYAPLYTLRDSDGTTVAKNRVAVSASMLTLGYYRNLNTDYGDYSISLVRIEAPLFIDLFKLGYIKDSNKNHWYYRPEIGVGYSILQLSLGYNFFFKKEGTEDLANVFTTLRGKYIF
ncbi:MAG: hypothetical protein P1U56_16680 [Saprospiraceae bacterium]|nr:hypothetical protein [Saprospiraceae bacterium]